VNELQAPLASIQELAEQARERVRQAPAERELAAIEAEAQKAASMVARLVTFASSEQVEARPVAVGDLLRQLIDFREGDWRASGIRRATWFSRALEGAGIARTTGAGVSESAGTRGTSAGRRTTKTLTIRTAFSPSGCWWRFRFGAKRVAQCRGDCAVLGLTQSVVPATAAKCV